MCGDDLSESTADRIRPPTCSTGSRRLSTHAIADRLGMSVQTAQNNVSQVLL